MAEEKKTATAEVCAACGIPVGADAVPTASGEGKYCRPCSYRAAMGAVQEDVEVKQAIVESVEPDKDGPGKVRKAIGAALLVGVIAGIAFVWTPVIDDAASGKQFYAVGRAGDAEPGLDECLGALWEIRVSLDRYLDAHEGDLPTALVELVGIQDECPATGKKWIYEKGEDGEYRIACPEPAQLGRAAIFLDHLNGPPRMSRAGEVAGP